MSGRFVRASKYRHVFGQSSKKEQCYDNLRISRNAWDTNLVKANPNYLSVNWEAGGGGAFAVIPLNEKGRLPERIPLFRGHTAAVLDTDWSPFDDSLVASGSDDGKAFLWRVPEGFSLHTDSEEPQDVAPIGKLVGHSRKVGHVLFNPAAENVLATSSGDYTIKIWDVETSSPRLTLKHSDIVQSLSWSANGSLLVTTSRDKKLRIWDVRQEKPAHEVPGHAGAKNSRAVWMGEHDRVVTTGFSKMSDRQLGLWDIRDPKEPIGGFQKLDSISGVCMPFWDDGTQCLYLAGKGDGNIRYFEYQHDKFEYLSEFKSPDPQRGIAFLPKRGVNVHENEIMRAFKTVNDAYIEPVSFIVPRRAEVFQNDIYPPAIGTKPAVSASEWFNGKDGIPAKINLESIYAGEEPVEVASDYKLRPASPKPAAAAPAPKKEPEPEQPKPAAPAAAAIAQRGPPPTMKETKGSIAEMADKFADKDEESSEEDDNSSFEEVVRPAEKTHSVAAKFEEKVKESAAAAKNESKPATSPTKTSTAEPPKPQPLSTAAKSAEPPKPMPTTSSSVPAPSSSLWTSKNTPTTASAKSATSPSPTNATAATAAEDPKLIASSLADIKALLEHQTRVMNAQVDKIGALTAEVDTLKSRVLGGGADDKGAGGSRSEREKDERIRELELELESARS